MKVLVANLGSTSFKYRLFDMADERVLARGGVERIGSAQSRCYVEAGAGREEATLAAPHPPAGAARLCLGQRAAPRGRALRAGGGVAPLGSRAAPAGGRAAARRVDD